MLTNPGRDSSYDNCTTTLESQPISPLPSGDDKPLMRFHEFANLASLTSEMRDDPKEYIELEVSGRRAGENSHLIIEIENALCPRGEDKLLTGFDEIATPTLLMHQCPDDFTERSYHRLAGDRGREDLDSILKVDVFMSPQSLQKATQTCLTPSEWQSVSDMPRINRTPYTNQTQRITPLKEKVRRRKQRSCVQYTDITVEEHNNFNSTIDSASSNCSTVSGTFSANSSNLEATRNRGLKHDTTIISFEDCCEMMTASTRERTQACQHYFKTGTMIDGDNGNLEEEDNIASNFSDISSRDEQFIDNSSSELDPTYSIAGRRFDDKIPGSSIRTLNDISSKIMMSQMSQIYIESDTDSDNDLGRFYVPSPLSKRYNSENKLVSSSLGYISSYPSVAGKSNNCDITK